MVRKGYTPEQIINVPRQAEAYLAIFRYIVFQVEFDSRACLRIQTNVVELGQSVGGEPDATAAIES